MRNLAIGPVRVGRAVPFEDAKALLLTAPILDAAKTLSDKGISDVFWSGGDGGPTVIARVSIFLLAEWADEATREFADFGSVIEQAQTERWAYDACEYLARLDLKRGEPLNLSLLKWRIVKPKAPSARVSKKPHLFWRDALLATLIKDAWAMGYPVEKRTGAVPMSALEIVSAVVAEKLGQHISVTLLKEIWRKNKGLT
ncbi:hypothetical protein RB2654_21238 [Rhodobacterales bacterium HTCC2654]|uniref:Uncharacterized protein n=2 Tax=Maritimibacter TaxID=404235 RepID=A3VKJ5_9RHOB|nr:hypothetical protein RB2654_21238 [Rhodobacterales bacterium HTCC2654] [Maritimibacter alkaliphilus HTCC2654]